MESVKVTLPDYKGIASRMKRRLVFVEENEIEDALSWMRKSRAKLTVKNQPAEKGDFVEIEYEMRGQAQKIKDGFILGESHLPKGFDEKLIGAKDGEMKEFFLNHPSGQELIFKVKIESICTMELAEINDQFARGLGKFEDLNGLRRNVQKGINAEKEIAESQRLRQEILDAISKQSEVEIPDQLIELEKKQILENLKKKVEADLKMGLEEYLTKIRQTEEAVLAAFLPEIEARLRNGLVLKAIAEKEKIEVSEVEIEKAVSDILKHQEGPEKAKKDLDPEHIKGYAKEVLGQEKTLSLLESFTS